VKITSPVTCRKIPQPFKLAISLQESARTIPFQEPTTVHDRNSIEVDDGTHAMRHGNDNAAGKLLTHDVPDELLGPLVDVAARLVYQDNPFVRQHGPGDAQKLALALREPIHVQRAV
jgi:hypothetical protein